MFIKIDELALEISDNIESIKHSISRKINRVDTINFVYYQAHPATASRVEFEAELLSDRKRALIRLKEIVNEGKAVKFKAFDDFIDCLILIESAEFTPQHYSRGRTADQSLYHTCKVKIAGVLLDGEREPR